MAQRILLDSSALKVSQPGVDVLSATPSQLLFSSDWSAMGVIKQGTYTIGSGDWSGSANTRRHTGSVNFPKTFATPPFCAFFMTGPGGSLVPVGFGSGAFFGGVRGSGTGGGQNCVLAHAQVDTAGIMFRAMFDKQYTPSLAVPSFSIRYFVFDYNT